MKYPEYYRSWVERNRERRKQYRREWYLRKKAENPDRNRMLYQKQRETRKRKYQIQTHDKRMARREAMESKKLETAMIRRIKASLRSRIYSALKSRKAGIKTIQVLGCSITDFLIHLESKFETGMTWENYGKAWHIDHIMPCAIFDLTKPEQQYRCFHFSNLQPMFARENIQKGKKIVTNQFNLL